MQALGEGNQEGSGALKGETGPPAPFGTFRARASPREIVPAGRLRPAHQELLDPLFALPPKTSPSATAQTLSPPSHSESLHGLSKCNQ